MCAQLLFRRVGKRISTKRPRNLPDIRDNDVWKRHIYETRLWYDDRERLDLTGSYKFKEGKEITKQLIELAPFSDSCESLQCGSYLMEFQFSIEQASLLKLL